MQIFFTTFLMIFLAELGDKTQLAVIGRAAEPAAKWTVFAAASLALLCSTLVAVQLGSLLTRYVELRYIKLGAGALFLIIGALVLAEGLRPARAETAPIPPAPLGALGRFVLEQATRFERSASHDYRALAARAANPVVRRTLLSLADEEDEHGRRVAGLQAEHGETAMPALDLAALPEEQALTHDVAASDAPILLHAIEHEEATATFYRQLAKAAALPALRQAFAALAVAEARHAATLRALHATTSAKA